MTLGGGTSLPEESTVVEGEERKQVDEDQPKERKTGSVGWSQRGDVRRWRINDRENERFVDTATRSRFRPPVGRGPREHGGRERGGAGRVARDKGHCYGTI